MISEETVWKEIWPVVEEAIAATLAEDEAALRRHLLPRQQAAEILELFGVAVFDILFKTVLGRGRLALTRAIETENGKYVHVELVWPDPELAGNSYTAADVVAVKLRQYRGQWRIMEINPASVDLPLTEARAAGILLSSKALSASGGVPDESWVLPVALFGGALQIPLRPEAMQDPVERLLLPGLQHRTYGVLSLVAGRRLWRDFKKKASHRQRPDLSQPAVWAACAEFIISEQAMRDQMPAAVGQSYHVALSAMLPRLRQIKETLHIEGLDERYSAIASTQIVLKDSPRPDENG